MDSNPVATARPERPLLWWIGTFAGAFLGVVLLVAVWAKMLDPMSFAEHIRQEKLDFLLSAEAVALYGGPFLDQLAERRPEVAHEAEGVGHDLGDAAAAPRTGTRRRPPRRSGFPPRPPSGCAPARRRSCA